MGPGCVGAKNRSAEIIFEGINAHGALNSYYDVLTFFGIPGAMEDFFLGFFHEILRFIGERSAL